jgi:hypothetical protein
MLEFSGGISLLLDYFLPLHSVHLGDTEPVCRIELSNLHFENYLAALDYLHMR